MEKKKQQRLKKQLEQQAGLLASEKDNAALVTSILATCGALLRTAREVMPGAVPEEHFDEVYSGYLGVANSVSRFCQANESRMADDEETAKKLMGDLKAAEFRRSQSESSVSNTKGAIAQEEKKITELNGQLVELQSRHAEVLNRKNEVDQQAETQKERLKKLQEELRSSEERIRQLDTQLEEMARSAQESRQNYEDLLSCYEEVDRIRDAMQEEGYVDLGSFSEKVRTMGEESTAFVREYEKFLSGMMKDMESLQDRIENRRKSGR